MNIKRTQHQSIRANKHLKNGKELLLFKMRALNDSTQVTIGVHVSLFRVLLLDFSVLRLDC